MAYHDYGVCGSDNLDDNTGVGDSGGFISTYCTSGESVASRSSGSRTRRDAPCRMYGGAGSAGSRSPGRCPSGARRRAAAVPRRVVVARRGMETAALLNIA